MKEVEEEGGEGPGMLYLPSLNQAVTLSLKSAYNFSSYFSFAEHTCQGAM